MVAFDGRVRRADVRGTCRKSRQRGPLREGIRAFLAHDYVTAARIFTDLAPHGNPVAQTYLGYMYANGKVCRKILPCRRDGIVAPANRALRRRSTSWGSCMTRP